MGATEVQAAAEAEGPEITEIITMDVAKVAAARTPANGTPFLMMKSLPPAEPAAKTRWDPDGDGDDDSAPEGDTDHDHWAEDGTQKRDVPGRPLAAKAAGEAGDSGQDHGWWIYPEDDLAKAAREFTAAQRRRHAQQGNALPDGSYPIPDADALRRAAILARSKHGNWKAAMRLIGRRARELGVRNPLDDDDQPAKGKKKAAKSVTVAKERTGVDTGTQDGLAKAVGDAVTKANEPLLKRIGDLESANKAQAERLAKVEALPQPGGPVLSVTRPGTDGAAVKRTRLLAKAEEYEELARTMTSPSDADAYAKLAAQKRTEAAGLDG